VRSGASSLKFQSRLFSLKPFSRQAIQEDSTLGTQKRHSKKFRKVSITS
jgi:hypothetical protein